MLTFKLSPELLHQTLVSPVCDCVKDSWELEQSNRSWKQITVMHSVSSTFSPVFIFLLAENSFRERVTALRREDRETEEEKDRESQEKSVDECKRRSFTVYWSLRGIMSCGSFLPCVCTCDWKDKGTHFDTSAMCLCLRVSHRSSSSSRTTSFNLVSPIPLVSKLSERARRLYRALLFCSLKKIQKYASESKMFPQCWLTHWLVMMLYLTNRANPATTEPKLSDCNNNQQNEFSDFPAVRAPSPVHVVLDAQQIVGHSLQCELM